MNRQDLQNLAEAYAQISEKKKDDSYLETDMKKRQENNEKARKEMAKVKGQKNPHFEQYTVTAADKKGNTTAYQNYKKGMKGKDGKPLYKAADHMKEENVDEATYPSDFKNPDGSTRSVAKKKTGRPVQHDQAMSGGRRKTVDEGVRDTDPEKGTAERKARLEKKRGMKMDDHPQYKKEEVEQVAEADSLAAMAARREKRLARQRKQMGTTATGQDFGHDYSISSAERKKRQQAEFDAFVGRGKKTKKESYDAMAKEYVTEILGAVGPAAAGVIGGTAGAVTGGKKKVKRAVATGTGAAAGAALGGPVGALIGGVAGRALS